MVLKVNGEELNMEPRSLTYTHFKKLAWHPDQYEAENATEAEIQRLQVRMAQFLKFLAKIVPNLIRAIFCLVYLSRD